VNIYRCKKRFLCGPLGRYIPVGAVIARYENILKMAVLDAPDSDNLFSVVVNGVEYYQADQITWLTAMVAPRSVEYFDLVGTVPEDAYGNVAGPATSSSLEVWNQTIGAEVRDLYTDGSSGLITVDALTAVQFRIQISVYNVTDNEAAGFDISGCIRRNEVSTALVGTLTKGSWKESGQTGVDATVVSASNALVVRVTGIADKTIKWKASVWISKVEV
jgi:hypothetical protein